MNIEPYVQEFQQQLRVAAGSGDEQAQEVAERLMAPLDAAIRLMLLDAIGGAVQEISLEMAPGAVELRLRGRDPEFVVTPADTEVTLSEAPAEPSWAADDDSVDSEMTRINLRLPGTLKARVEDAANDAGMSTNAWLVRAATTSLGRNLTREDRHPPRGRQHETGWAR